MVPSNRPGTTETDKRTPGQKSLRWWLGLGGPFVGFSHPGAPGVAIRSLPWVWLQPDWPPGVLRRLGR